MPDPRQGAGRRSVGIAVCVTIATNMPLMMMGALVVQITAEVHIPPWALGVAVAAYWIAAAASSLTVGRVAAGVPERWLILITLGLASVSLVGLAFLGSWQGMTAWAVVGGIANGWGHPASNRMIGRAVPDGHRGVAFGIKQAAVPLSGLLAGLALPLIALTIGWRAGFGFAAVAAIGIGVAFLLTTRPVSDVTAAEIRGTRRVVHTGWLPRSDRIHFIVLAVGTGLSGGAAIALVSFAVSGATARGIDAGLAGLVLATGSLLGAIARVLVGVSADRGRGGSLLTIAAMVVGGSVGAFAMAGMAPATYVIGFLVAGGIGWGWPGLMHLHVSRTAGPHTLAATGIVQTGTYIGGAAAPLAVGILVGGNSASALPWVVIGTMFLGGAGMFLIARRGIRRAS